MERGKIDVGKLSARTGRGNESSGQAIRCDTIRDKMSGGRKDHSRRGGVVGWPNNAEPWL